MQNLKWSGLMKSAAVLLLSWMAAPGLAWAAYPDKPLRLVVPFGAGGSADALGRVVAEGLSLRLGQTVVVENRPGATGIVGSQAVVRAQPDGYTLLLGYDGTMVIAPALKADFPFDTRKDLKPVSKLADVGLIVAVHPSIPAKNIKELIDYSQTQASKVSFATPGIGSTAHMAGELLRLSAGMQWLHIPYASGSGKFVVDLMAGVTPAAYISVNTAAPFIKEGKIRGVGVPTTNRDRNLPDVPTFSEVGVTGLDAASWFALFAPAGTPDAIVELLNAEVTSLLRDESVSERLRNMALEPAPSTPQEFAELIDEDLKKWTKVAREAGLSE
ncbi:MAG: tripartite tricarboxylate transporter substrate binding protein [Pusillimonas sp.]